MRELYEMGEELKNLKSIENMDKHGLVDWNRPWRDSEYNILSPPITRKQAQASAYRVALPLVNENDKIETVSAYEGARS